MIAVVKELEDKCDKITIWREKNRRFHELIVLSCGNSKIHEVFIRTLKRLRWCTYVALPVPGRKNQSISEHRKILKAFLNRDQSLVEKAICDHITTVQNLIKIKKIDVARFAQ